MIEKHCKHCGASFGLDSSHWFTDSEGAARCRIRRREYQREYYNRNRKGASDYQRKANLRRNYGITQDEYNNMMVNQSDRCAICLTDEKPKGSDYWHVDHDHATGEVRGLLCGKCNAALGMMNDDVDNLMQAINYLEGVGTNV